jgi:hypothetical protein
VLSGPQSHRPAAANTASRSWPRRGPARDLGHQPPERPGPVNHELLSRMAALLRAADLPARSVSGYLHPNPAAEPGQTAPPLKGIYHGAPAGAPFVTVEVTRLA